MTQTKSLSLTVLFSLFFLMGCEKMPEIVQNIEDTIPLDELLTNESNETVSAEPSPSVRPEEKRELVEPVLPITPASDSPPAKVATQQDKMSEAKQPEFSAELMKIVQNWKRVPKGFFPVPSVLISAPANFEVKANGKVLVSTPVPTGSEVTVLGLHGSTLTIAPPIPEGTPRKLFRPNMIGTIDIDNTDFKQCVAFAYEMHLLNKQKAQEMKVAEKVENKPASSSPPKAKAQNPLAIPDPLDFGHGRFCICKDCREKRLAATGSLKTGHGLEP